MKETDLRMGNATQDCSFGGARETEIHQGLKPFDRLRQVKFGRRKKIEITKEEQKIVQRLEPTLKKLGLIFVGLDIIDGWITEINVTSPAGITEIDELYDKRVESCVLDWLEKSM